MSEKSCNNLSGDLHEYIDHLKTSEELDDIWNENRILSLEDSNKQYMNIMIQTSKIFNMIRINVSSQIWF